MIVVEDNGAVRWDMLGGAGFIRLDFDYERTGGAAYVDPTALQPRPEADEPTTLAEPA